MEFLDRRLIVGSLMAATLLVATEGWAQKPSKIIFEIEPGIELEENELELESLLEPDNRPLTKDEVKALSESLDDADDTEEALNRFGALNKKAKRNKYSRGPASIAPQAKTSVAATKPSTNAPKSKTTGPLNKKLQAKAPSPQEKATPIPLLTDQEKGEIQRDIALAEKARAKRSSRPRAIVNIEFKN